MKYIGWGAFITLVILIGAYLYIFRYGISYDSNDWGNFGGYIGGIGSVVLSFSIFLYTYMLDKQNEKSRRAQQKEEWKIQLLKQIELILSKIEICNNLSNSINTNSTWERGCSSHDVYEKQKEILEIEIRTSFAVAVSLAKSYGINDIPNENQGIKLKDAREYSIKWLDYIENNKI